MIKNIFLHWRTSAPGVGMIVTGVSTLIALIIHGTLTAELAAALIMGIFGGVGFLCAQDAAQGAKAHAESQEQIAQLQLRSNIVPNAIDSGDTSQLRKVPMTPAAVPPPFVPALSPVDPQPPKP